MGNKKTCSEQREVGKNEKFLAGQRHNKGFSLHSKFIQQ